MTQPLFEELAARFIECGSSPEEEQQLLALISQPGAERCALRQQVLMHRILQQSARPAIDVELVMRALPQGNLESKVLRGIDAAQGTWPRRRRAPRGWGRVLLASCAAVCVSAGLLVYWWCATPEPSGVAQIASVEAGVVGVPLGAILRNGQRHALTTGAALQLNDMIESQGAALTLKYCDEQTTVRLHEATTLVLAQPRQAKLLSLKNGALTIVAAPQPHAHPLRVVTPHAEVEVIGTKFTLRVEETLSRVSVDKGTVNFIDKRTRVSRRLTAGGTAATALAALPPLPNTDAALHYDFEDGQSSLWSQGRVVKNTQLSGSQFCLEGEVSPKTTYMIAAELESWKPGLFRCGRDSSITLHSRLGDARQPLSLWVYNSTQRLGYQYDATLKSTQWQQVQVALSAFFPDNGGKTQINPDDLVCFLRIRTPNQAGNSLQIDNVHVQKVQRVAMPEAQDDKPAR